MRPLTLLIFLFHLAASSAFAQTVWQPVASGTGKNLLSIDFPSPQVGYIGGADSLLLKTTNGGLTWQQISTAGILFTPSAQDVVDVDFLTPNHGFAVIGSSNYTGFLYETLDGGQTWTQVNTQQNMVPYAMYLNTSTKYFLLGSAFFAGNNVMRYNGIQWETPHAFSYQPESFERCADFYDSLQGITGGDGGYFHRTFDGGVTWDTIYSGDTSGIAAVIYLDKNTLLAGKRDYGSSLFISKDQGATWALDFNTLTFFYPSFTSITHSVRDSFIAVGKFGSLISNDRGIVFWKDRQNQNFMYEVVDKALNKVAIANGGIAYIVGDSGMIYTNRQSVNLKYLAQKNQESISVYPNPTQDFFLLKTKDGKLPEELFLLDATGKCVQHWGKTFGKYSLNKALTAGQYFLTGTLAEEQFSLKIQLR